jgi:hypothetical protein
MESYYYSLFFVFAIILALMVVDPNVGQYIVLLQKMSRIKYEKMKWWLLYNPANPLVKYIMWRRAMKMAEDLQKEFEKDSLT